METRRAVAAMAVLTVAAWAVLVVAAMAVLTVAAWAVLMVAASAAPAPALVVPTHSLCSSGSLRIPACQSRTLRARAGTSTGSTRQTHRSTQGTRQRCCRSPSSSPRPPSESQAAELASPTAMEKRRAVAAMGLWTVAAMEMRTVVATG